MSHSRKRPEARKRSNEGIDLGDLGFSLAQNPSAFHSHPAGQEAFEKYKADNSEMNLLDLKELIKKQLALLNKNSTEFKKSETTVTADKCLKQATASFNTIQSEIKSKSIDLDDEAKVDLSKFKTTAQALLADITTVYASDPKTTSSREATNTLIKNIADFYNKYSPPEEKKGHAPHKP